MRHLPAAALAGLFLAPGLLPMHQFDLGAKLCGLITRSDASETGGGVCWRKALRLDAAPAALADPAQGGGVGRDEVGLIELFRGIGGGRMALERIGVEVAVHASTEVLPEVRGVASQRWPPCVEFSDVKDIDEPSVRGLLAWAPRLRVATVMG